MAATSVPARDRAGSPERFAACASRQQALALVRGTGLVEVGIVWADRMSWWIAGCRPSAA
jgi:hypothetical protein